jgi:predicted Zn-dependent protease
MALALVLAFPALFNAATAQQLSIIRDAEIEDTIRGYAAPLFKAAGLSPDAVEVHIVASNELNAFVAGGQKIFVFTGLLLASENPSQIIGVLAHEVGHIMGGHLARAHDALRAATNQSILTVVLGVAAVASGQGDVAAAILAGGAHLTQASLLQYSRIQESSADQAALQLLDATGQSAAGFLAFLDILGDQEALLQDSQDPYVRSHPLSRDRVRTVREHIARARQLVRLDSPESMAAHRRMTAKLVAFLRPPRRALKAYPDTDKSIEGRYARAIAYYRIPEIPRALVEIDGLLKAHPDNPFFHELKGQMLFENGRGLAALAPYESAVALRPESGLLRLALAQVLVAADDPALNAEAVRQLEIAVRSERRHPGLWRQLAVAYGRAGDLGLSALATAEQYLLFERKDEAHRQAQRAQGRLAEGTPGWLRAQDILQATEYD